MTTLAIIEDDDDLRAELVEEMRFRGHKVFEAANGDDGFRVITQSNPDIVLSDIDMPIENGFDLMRRAGSSERGSRIGPQIELRTAVERSLRQARRQVGR